MYNFYLIYIFDIKFLCQLLIFKFKFNSDSSCSRLILYFSLLLTLTVINNIIDTLSCFILFAVFCKRICCLLGKVIIF